MLLAAFDWTPIVAAAVIALPAYFGVLVSLLNRRDLRTDSGDSLGRVAERTHDMAAANQMMLQKINGDLHPKDKAADG